MWPRLVPLVLLALVLVGICNLPGGEAAGAPWPLEVDAGGMDAADGGGGADGAGDADGAGGGDSLALVSDEDEVGDVPESPYTTAEARLLADVVCSECRGCPRAERAAVMHVAVNRAERPGWWGRGLEEVLLAPGQFAAPGSKWCSAQLPAPPKRKDGVVGWSPGMVRRHERMLREIEEDVEGVLAGRIPDPTRATYFHAKWVCRGKGRWTKEGKRRLCYAGDTPWPDLEELAAPEEWQHRFFRLPVLAMR